MKNKLILVFIFFTFTALSQSEIYYYKDFEANLEVLDIEDKTFNLLEYNILEKQSDAIYWFKIPASNSKEDYIFRIKNYRANNSIAYQNRRPLEKIKNSRFTSYKIQRDYPVFIKVSSEYSAYYPVELKLEEEYHFDESVQILINSFYYGAAFLIIVFSIVYYFFFKDNSFIHHCFLLMSLVFAFLASDGIFNFFNFNNTIIDNLILFNYFFLGFFSFKFAHNFLLVDNYYPGLKKYSHIIIVNIFLFVVLFYFFRKSELFVILNILTFLLFLTYWIVSVLLINKSAHIKLFTIAFVIILFNGINFTVLKNFGISFFDNAPFNMKIGGLVQVVTLSFAVVYREKTLRKRNSYMKNEIINFNKEIDLLTSNIDKESKIKDIENLSIREREVFDLIVIGKSNKEIALEVNVSINTVKFHVKNIYGKLNIKSRKEVLTIDKNQ
ncbi:MULTISPECIES: LuxR C-terminal-related transcriptional regulator [Polaribacter]|uniref:LuxR C-terminal-related transcriptional regulator n=1 Tax=Polaribacter marinaquae TaxID=1642819 RepID=A0ABZ2TWJ3_9FLAO